MADPAEDVPAGDGAAVTADNPPGDLSGAPALPAASPATAAAPAKKSAKATLLKRGLMPDYRSMRRSEEGMENLLARRSAGQQNNNNQWLENGGSEVPQSSLPSLLEDETISEQVIILHSLFSNFCSPTLSVEAVSEILLLERRRVAALFPYVGEDGAARNRNGERENEKNGVRGLLPAAKNGTPEQQQQQNQPRSQLPKETLVHTSPSSLHFLIKLLRANPKSCLLKLPLEFQLALFRILTRLLSEECDDEYDEECLFDWSFVENNVEDGCEGGEDDGSEEAEEGEAGGGGRESDDEESYDVVGRSSVGSSHDKTKSNGNGKNKTGEGDLKNTMPFRRSGSSTLTHSHQTNFRLKPSAGDSTGKAFEAWSHARWKKKKSAPLYSIIRFCTNPGWREDFTNGGLRGSITKRRSLKWNYVADNVKLGEEEEKALAGEDSSGSDDEEGESSNFEASGIDTVGIFIRIYQAILNKCFDTRKKGRAQEGQYLLLGPVAHLIGLLCATRVSVKNLRLLLVLVEIERGNLIDFQSNNLSSGRSDSGGFFRSNSGRSNHNDGGNGGSPPVLTLARLHIIRALRHAAEYSVQFNGILDKPGPPVFFSFGRQEQADAMGVTRKKVKKKMSGLSCTLEMAWPFKYDFGMACWFRAESFSPNATAGDDGSKDGADGEASSVGGGGGGRHVVLFSARTQSGAQIEVSFESHSLESMGGPSSAATLIVTVVDASAAPGTVDDKKSQRYNRSNSAPGGKILRRVRLVGCVLSPKVWYHVAVRLNHPRALSRFSLAAPLMSSKDQVSIFLNGKMMLKESMKMPQFPSDGKQKGGLFGSGSFGASSEPKRVPVEISFFNNFDGQAGSLYVFKEHVSQETVHALYRETAAPSEQSNLSHFGTFVDRWDGNHSRLNHLTKAVSAAGMHSKLGDVVLPNYSVFTGEEHGSSSLKNRKKILFDLVDDEDNEAEPHMPAGLSHLSFGSKLLIVWDPTRIADGILLDPHLGAHVSVEDRAASTWSFESVRDTIESLGGMRRLLPLFGVLRTLGTGRRARQFHRAGSAGSQRNVDASSSPDCFKGIVPDHPNMLLPGLLFLVASFAREHEANARELFRCGGIDVIEKLLNDCKRKDAADGGFYRLGASPAVARLNASALLDLWQASRLNFALETAFFSRLLFNVSLLLGGVARAKGAAAFHAVMLPVLSEIAMMNPDKVRDCVGTGELFDVVNEYSGVGGDEIPQEMSPESDLFYRPSFSSSSPESSALTLTERSFVVDTLLGIIVMMLSQRCPTQDLSPLLTFVTYNLDLEWEANSAEMKSTGEITAKRSHRYQSTVKATSILFFLLQKPNVPGLMNSLGDIFENGSCVASWMLCCLVNSFDDTIRGLGIKCLAAYLRLAATATLNVDVSNGALAAALPSGHDGTTTAKLSKTMKLGLEAIGNTANNMFSNLVGRINIKVVYKLLWHLLKCHRERLGDASTTALMYMIVGGGDGGGGGSSSAANASSVPLSDIIVPNGASLGGFRLSLDELAERSSKVESRQSIQNKYGVSTVLRLLRFLPNDQKERWLFDLLAFLLATPKSVDIILSCDDWQPVLFQLVAEVLDEIYGEDSTEGAASNATTDEKTGDGNVSTILEQRSDSNSSLSSVVVNTETLSKPSVRTRYDLSLKLYSALLGHCVRRGDEKAFDAVEMAASLQRVNTYGSEIFSILLSHLFADLIEKGTLASVERTYDDGAVAGGGESSAGGGSGVGGGGGAVASQGKNRALKQSARLVTQAILSNGLSGLDMASAVKQWRCLRHLTALTVAVVTESGFGIVQLFDYRNQDASAVDGITGGMYGIRLDNLVSGVNAFEALASAKLHPNNTGRHKRDRHRYVCVVLASQVLTLLDAFIFPDNLDAAKAASQLHGLALVRSTEPRLGQSQGTLLASLVRLSLVLLAYLEPSSVKFLQACSRLRCFLHWVLEILRESVALGGYNQAFHELTAPLDRMVLAIVLQCHRALSRCSVVLMEMESNPWQKYFADIESRHKGQRRLFRAILELREIVLAAYRGRNEVLRAALSPQAYEALSHGLEEVTIGGGTPSKAGASDSPSREALLRSFLENGWISGFHDVEVNGSLVIPEQISSGQLHEGRPATTRGQDAIQEIVTENYAIVREYSALLNAPFTLYCENQRRWAETDAVRDREYEGDVSVKNLSTKHKANLAECAKLASIRFSLASRRFHHVVRLANDPYDSNRHWMFASRTDLMYRRITFHPNYDFNDHREASYELALGKDREDFRREEAARKEREREVVAEAALRAAIVPYKEAEDEEGEESLGAEEEDEEDDFNGLDKEGFLGWEVRGEDDSANPSKCDDGEADGKVNDEGGNKEKDEDKEDECLQDDASNKEKDNMDESEWDQIESADVLEDAGGTGNDPLAWARKFMWNEGEHFVHSFESAVVVSVRTTRAGTLLLTNHGIYFHQTGDTIDVMTKEKFDGRNGGPSMARRDEKWKLNRLTDVHGRRYMLKAQALELFFADMKGLFLTFNGTKERDLFHAKLRGNCKAPLLRSFKSLNPRVVFKKSKLIELWRKRKISNYQYIMALNLMAGRTFNDITQYPVFPWILADYTSETLDLSDEKVYRDLTKPVGALNSDRLAQLLDRYNDLDGFPEEEKFLYGSHYSSPGVVLHYLIRQEPYTSMHITLQSGRFDCADRLFFDLGGCWRSCNTSTSDVKELLPEFFSCPEMFENTNHFPFGETQAKMSIDNVKLPPWAKGSPHEFVRLHRLALESEYVSNNLHHWIDLIFGYKQRGPAALAANNVFHYLSYEGSVDIDKVTDEVERSAIEGHIQNFGQTPSQLITKESHPSRSRREAEPVPLFKDLCLLNMRCDTPKKQFGGPDRSVKGAIISMQSIGDSIYAIHSDFSLCTYKLHHARGAVPFYFKNEKARGLESKNASLSHNIIQDENYLERPNADETDDTENSEMKRRQGPMGNASFAIALGVGSSSSSSSSSDPSHSHLLMSCGYFDDCVKIHALDSLQLQGSQNGGHRGHINCLAVGDGGEMMVTGGDDATCRVWVVDHEALAVAITDGNFNLSPPGKEGPEETRCFVAHVLLGHVAPVCCVALSTKLDVVISGSRDGTVCVHNIRSGRFVRALHVDAETKEVRESHAGHEGIPVAKLAVHADGSFVAHLGDGSLYVVSVNGRELCRARAGERLNAMIICPRSETLITGGETGNARIWRLHDLGLRCTVDVKRHGAITSLALTPIASQFLCIGSSNGLLSIVSRKNDSSGASSLFS